MVTSLVLRQLLIAMLMVVPMAVQGQPGLPGEDCIPTGGTAEHGNCNTDSDCCDIVSECNADGTCTLPPLDCTDETCGDDESCIAGASCVPLDAEVNMTGFGDPDSPFLAILSYDGDDVQLMGEEDISGNINVTKAITFDLEVKDSVHILFDGLDRPEKMFLEKDPTNVFKLVFDESDCLVGMVEDEDAGGNDRRLLSSTNEEVDIWHLDPPQRRILPSEQDGDPVCRVSWPVEKPVRCCSLKAPNCLGTVCKVFIIVHIVEINLKEECCVGSYCLEDFDL